MLTIEERFKNGYIQYANLKQIYEPQVVRWEVGKAPIYEPRPFYNERFNHERGRILSRPPSKVDAVRFFEEYGFDKNNQLLVDRDYNGYGKWHETFYIHLDHVIEGSYYQHAIHQDELVNVTRQIFEAGRLIAYESAARYGSERERYSYTNGKLTWIDFQHQGKNGLTRRQYQITYTARGNLDTIIELLPDDLAGHTEPRRFVHYQRPKKMRTQTALSNKIKSVYVNLIPQIVRNVQISEQVYCLTLAYNSDYSAGFLPPFLGLGLESERQAVLKEGRSPAAYLWNPAEYTKYGYNEPKLLLNVEDEHKEICRLLNQEMASSPIGSCIGMKLIYDVAVELMKFDWKSILNVTPDFVVYAYCGEGPSDEGFMHDFSASVPKTLIDEFKKKGYFN